MLKGEYLWVSPSFASTAEYIVCGANTDACKFGDEIAFLLMINGQRVTHVDE